MSLINDALKRAKQAQQKSPAPLPTTAPAPAWRAAERTRRNESNPGILLPLALVTLVGVGGLVIWFAMKAGHLQQSPTTVAHARSVPMPVSAGLHTPPNPKLAIAQPPASPTAGAPVARAPEATPSQPIGQFGSPAVVANLSPLPVSTVATASTEAQSVPAQPVTVSTSTVPMAAVSAPAAVASGLPPLPPLPKLQGIFYRPQRPAALVNGKLVLIDSMVGEHRVLAISQQSVTVARAGQTNVLEMPD